jgi:hypothetical protein
VAAAAQTCFHESPQPITMRQRSGQDGLTVYQLLVSIVVIVILGALWGAFNKHQQIKQQQQSCLPEVRHG